MRFSAVRNRAVGAITNYFDRGYDAAALFDNDEETPTIRRHLDKLLSAVMFVSLGSTLGSYCCLTSAFPRIISAFEACLRFRSFHRTAPSEQSTRFGHLYFCVFLLWASITPWLTWFLGVDNGFVACIMLDTALLFNTFRVGIGHPYPFTFDYFQDLVLYGPGPSFCLNSWAISVFGADYALWRIKLWWLNVLSMAYVVLYSKEVTLRVRGGDDDHVKHALHFYTDFPSFVIHLLKWLWKLRRR